MQRRDLDFYQRLTLVLKMGYKPKTRVNKNKNRDVPVSKESVARLRSQFEKATTSHYYDVLDVSPELKLAYLDFDAMDYTPEISAALDIFADESVMTNIDNEIIHIDTDDDEVREELEQLLYNVLDIRANIWHWVRSTVKYGNFYMLFNIDPDEGINSFIPLPIEQMQREEAYDKNLNSVKFRWIDMNETFDEWQIGHFRLLNSINEHYYPYGTSTLESARRIWKQLQLAEDAMIIYRITRAPERRVFYIDVGNIDAKDIKDYIQKIKDTVKRTPLVEQGSGGVTYKFNPISIDEDFFIPRRNDKASQIETLPGASNLNDIADIEYLQQKLFTALKIPKAFLSYEEDINAKATLSGQDSRFARTINRIQQSIIAELTKICVVHLYSIGYTDRERLNSFELSLNSPSSQHEIEQLEVYKQKAEIVMGMWNETSLSPISLVWGLRKVMGFTDDEIVEIFKQQYLEGKMNMKITSTADAYLAGDIKMKQIDASSKVATTTQPTGDVAYGDDNSGEDDGRGEDGLVAASAALNGAQITSAVAVIAQYTAGAMSEVTAIELLAAVGIGREDAKRMVAAEAKHKQENPSAPPVDPTLGKTKNGQLTTDGKIPSSIMTVINEMVRRPIADEEVDVVEVKRKMNVKALRKINEIDNLINSIQKSTITE